MKQENQSQYRNQARHHDDINTDNYAPGEVKITKVPPEKLDEYLGETEKKHKGRPKRQQPLINPQEDGTIAGPADKKENPAITVLEIAEKVFGNPEGKKEESVLDHYNFDFCYAGEDEHRSIPRFTINNKGTTAYINMAAFSEIKKLCSISHRAKIGIDFKNKAIIIIPVSDFEEAENCIPLNGNSKSRRITIKLKITAKKKMHKLGMIRADGEIVEGKMLFKF